MIKAVVFDLDGTILNTITTITHFVNQTLQKHGISSINTTECKRFIGDGAKKLIERSVNSKGVFDISLTENILIEYNSSYDADPYYLTEKYEGIDELLLELKSRDIKLGVISNKPNPTTISAVKHFYPDLFDVVIGGQVGVPLKPSVEAAELMMRALYVRANEIIYVGDSGVDMKFGKAFGAAYTLGVLWGFRDEAELVLSGADYVFNNSLELKKFILEKI